MHQLASTLLSFFLSPFNWIIILLIASYFLKKRGLNNACKITAVVIFIVFGNQWLLNLYAKNWQAERVAISNLPTASCGIVPGGFASPDQNGDGYFNASADRFIQVVKLYKLGKIKHIVISGGNGKIEQESFQEGAWVKRELITFGIPDSVIFVEDKSNNTAENATNAKQILSNNNLQPPYLLITSAFHMPRASLNFKKSGLTIVPFPCNFSNGMDSFSISDLLPTPSVLLGWDLYLKETAGYLWYKLE
jgi:uncharacterized SAM-binding protein YcdF (DUF218 family)